MFDRFGEMNSAAELNDLADNLLNEGDMESLEEMAKENGIQMEYIMAYQEGEIPFLCDDMTAALGKIDVEEKELKPQEIMQDWTEYLKAQCMENEELARCVRQKGKSLKGMIGALLSWSFKHQQAIDKDIIKAAGVTAAGIG